jgi:hypothetical protein
MIAKKFCFLSKFNKRRKIFIIFPISRYCPFKPNAPAHSSCHSAGTRAFSNILIFGMRIEEDSDEMEVDVLAGSRTRHLAARVVQPDLVTLCYLKKETKLISKSIKIFFFFTRSFFY